MRKLLGDPPPARVGGAAPRISELIARDMERDAKAALEVVVPDELVAARARISELESALAKAEQRADEAERQRDNTSAALQMVGSELSADPKMDPFDKSDPRWTPTLLEARKVRRRVEAAEAALALAQRGEAEARENAAVYMKAFEDMCYGACDEENKLRAALHCPPETDLAAWAEYVGRVYEEARALGGVAPGCDCDSCTRRRTLWRTLDSGPRAGGEDKSDGK